MALEAILAVVVGDHPRARASSQLARDLRASSMRSTTLLYLFNVRGASFIRRRSVSHHGRGVAKMMPGMSLGVAKLDPSIVAVILA